VKAGKHAIAIERAAAAIPEKHTILCARFQSIRVIV
jgi:hypothetical protein